MAGNIFQHFPAVMFWQINAVDNRYKMMETVASHLNLEIIRLNGKSILSVFKQSEFTLFVPQILHKLLLWNTLGKSAYSQEYLAKFGGKQSELWATGTYPGRLWRDKRPKHKEG